MNIITNINLLYEKPFAPRIYHQYKGVVVSRASVRIRDFWEYELFGSRDILRLTGFCL
jgi:hypothetical protein